jgi:hypothetical protein
LFVLFTTVALDNTSALDDTFDDTPGLLLSMLLWTSVIVSRFACAGLLCKQ